MARRFVLFSLVFALCVLPTAVTKTSTQEREVTQTGTELATYTEAETYSLTRTLYWGSFSVSRAITLSITSSFSHFVTETKSVGATDSLPRSSTLTVTCQEPMIVVYPLRCSLYDAMRYGLVVNFTVDAKPAPWEALRTHLTTSWGSIGNVTVVGGRSIFLFLIPSDKVELQSAVTATFTFAPNAFLCRLDASVEVPIYLESSRLPTSGALRRLAGSASIIGGTLGAVLASGMVVSQARAAMMLEFSMCQFSHSEELPTSLNPTNLGFGPAQGFYYRGAVVGNVLLMLVSCTAIYCCALAHYVSQKEKCILEQVVCKFRLPGLFVASQILFLQPIAAMSTALAFHGQWGFLDGFIAFCGFALCFAPFVILSRTVVLNFGARSTLRKFLPRQELSFAGKCLQLFNRSYFGSVKWQDDDAHPNFKKKYSVCFAMYRHGYTWTILCEMVVLCVQGVIEGLRPNSESACQASIALSLVVAVALAFFYLAARPYASLLVTGYLVGAALLSCAAAVALLANAKVISDYMSVIQILCSLAFVVIGFVLLGFALPAHRLRQKCKNTLREIIAQMKLGSANEGGRRLLALPEENTDGEAKSDAEQRLEKEFCEAKKEAIKVGVQLADIFSEIEGNDMSVRSNGNLQPLLQRSILHLWEERPSAIAASLPSEQNDAGSWERELDLPVEMGPVEPHGATPVPLDATQISLTNEQLYDALVAELEELRALRKAKICEREKQFEKQQLELEEWRRLRKKEVDGQKMQSREMLKGLLVLHEQERKNKEQSVLAVTVDSLKEVVQKTFQQVSTANNDRKAVKDETFCPL